METKEVAQLLGEAILLLESNRSVRWTRQLLKLKGYTPEQISETIDFIQNADFIKRMC
jgi:hypothetical protein